MADNNNTYGMSDYQKIIFVNNINEQSSLLKDQKYNFAVYFADNLKSAITQLDDAVHYPENIINIWHKGQRLNRFIGVDKTSNAIVIGTETYELKFDYPSGLLSIIQTNALSSINIEKVYWTPFNQGDTSEIIGGETREFVIDAESNIFTIRIRYTAKIGFNISAITESLKTLSLTCKSGNENVILKNATVVETISNEAIIDYQYQILAETNHNNNLGSDNNNIKYTINGPYNLYIEDRVFRFNLNPTSLTIFDSNNNEVSRTVNISNASGIYNIPFNVRLEPYNISSIWKTPSFNPNHPIYLVVKTSDANNIQIVEANGQDTAWIRLSNNSENYFNLKTNDITTNTAVSARITVALYYNNTLLSNNNISKCNKYFDLTITGVQNKYLLYYGYDDPASRTFDINKLISYSNKNNYDILYDYNWDVNGGGVNDENRTFYVAVPKFDKMNVRLVYDVYDKNGAYNDIEEYNTANNTIIPGHVFAYTENNITINGTEYVVYSSKTPGKFYGKIQIKR